ncbi:MAG: glycoside hydrolase family 78 protein [Abditibacteriales bacterium]|nr:glycoside hydrolase family 78 protein [Abditibacteriales bacterium]
MKWLFVITPILLMVPSARAASMKVEGLRTEYLENPVGIDTVPPRFSWRLVSATRGARQTAYQVQVASSEKLLNRPDVWDSGKVASSQSLHVPCGGKALRSQTRYFWRVRVWDENGKPSAFSPTAFFEMGLLQPSEWTGKWITSVSAAQTDNLAGVNWIWFPEGNPRADAPRGTRFFRKAFDIPANKPVKTAVLTASADNVFRAFLNGHEVSAGEDFKTPRAVMVHEQLTPGKNVLAISARNNEGPAALAVRLKITYADGSVATVTTDATWKTFNAQRANWQSKDFNDADWKDALVLAQVGEAPWGALTEGVAAGPAPMMRRSFRLNRKVTRARAYVTGLGYYELYLNGQKVGDRVLDPPYTNFGKRVYYSTYDVTNLLKQGENCVGAILGQGWWRQSPRLLLQLNITLADGSQTSVVSDEHWRWAPSPIVENSLYDGETYDATREQRGWNVAGFDDSAWQPVSVVEMRGVALSAQMIQPIRVVETLTPQKITEPKPGVYVFDFGQNFSGWCQLKVTGQRGTKVTLKHAEVLFPDGTVNQQNLRSAKATDTYILRGDALTPTSSPLQGREEVYEPRFTYHGFRYVQVEGFPGVPTPDSLRGRVVHTAFERRGTFACSNDLLNQIHRNALWGFRTNFHSIPTDCCQRDERQGWMGDAHMTADTGLYHFDVPPAYAKFLRDIQDAQGEDGRIPDTVPHVWGSNPGDPMWAAAYHFILWDVYRHTGDRQLLAQHYDGLKRYVEMLRREARDTSIITRNNYGDWVGIEPTPPPLISTGSFYLVSRIVADIAEILGKQEDAKEYRALCDKIAAAFNAQFYDARNEQYGNGSQFSHAFPLYLGIVPPEKRETVIAKLIHSITEKHKMHLSTGFIGTKYLLDTLTHIGRVDIAYAIAAQDTYPSWGYMVKMGATTIWELWKYETGPGMNSHNHPAFGLVSGWFVSTLAGIKPDPHKPGWERVIIQPHVTGDLKWAEASVDTLRGTVAVRWALMLQGTEAYGVRLHVTVPANATATVYVPKVGRQPYVVKEGQTVLWRGGKMTARVPGVRSAQDAGNWIA